MGKRLTSLILGVVLTCSISLPVFAEDIDTRNDIGKLKTIEDLKELNGKKENLKTKNLKTENGQVFLSGELSEKKVPSEAAAREFLEKNKETFGITNTSKELRVIETKKDDLGNTFIKFAQVIDEIPVEDSFINICFDNSGVISSANGKIEDNKSITELGTKNISESEAVNIAKNQFDYKELEKEPKIERLILNKDDKNYEVYKVNIYFIEPTRGNYDVFVEVNSGKVVNIENNIRYDGLATGTGVDVLGAKKDLNLYLKSGVYLMNDQSRPSTSGIYTYDMNNGTSTGILVKNSTNYFGEEGHKASVSAHYNAGKVIDFYKNIFGRNSLDDNGMEINSFTHYGYKYNNAFWDGYEMVYGDGDGEKFTYLSGDLDVVGHEMTHGIIEHTAELQYHNQPGALNESIADVFGVLISTYNKYNVANGGVWKFNSSDWVIGDDIYTPNISGDALRSLSNPTLYDQTAHMNNYRYYPDTEMGDWGGVHINSGIPNKAAYNLASSIGMKKTAEIYYRALENYIMPNTDFNQVRNCLTKAAIDLYGENSSEITAIATAFDAVGINETSTWQPIDDPYEPNDSIEDAYPINFGTVYKSYISSEFDLDIYKLSINKLENMSILLSDLPADYDLLLIDPNGDIVSFSDNENNEQEIINYKATIYGDYYIAVVSSYGDYSIDKKYSLKANTSNEKPVISGVAEATIKVGDTFNPKTGIKATDKEDGDITSKIAISGKVDTSKIGKYTLTYTVTDSSGNKVSKNRIITVTARNVQVTSLIGSDRYDTAVRLSKGQFSTANTIMIANGAALADGLAATPLATYKKAPLLLTEVNTLPEITKNEIKRLGAKNAIIVGGSGVVSDKVIGQLKSLGITTVERLGGATRYETSLKIAQYIDKNCYDISKVVISNGYGEADALSIASAAGRDKMAILLVDRDSIPTNVYNWIKGEALENAYIIGGTGVVSDSVLNKVNGVTKANIANNRLGGKNRFVTNAMVIDKFYGNVMNKTYIAKGWELIDALAAGPAAAANGSPVILADSDLSSEQKTVLNKRYGNIIIRTGGGISDKAVNTLKNCLQQ